MIATASAPKSSSSQTATFTVTFIDECRVVSPDVPSWNYKSIGSSTSGDYTYEYPIQEINVGANFEVEFNLASHSLGRCGTIDYSLSGNQVSAVFSTISSTKGKAMFDLPPIVASYANKVEYQNAYHMGESTNTLTI